ncbi:MAG: LamG-like jellyroll fold domain-containing protein [Candidatus Omnitrophota bacterium]
MKKVFGFMIAAGVFSFLVLNSAFAQEQEISKIEEKQDAQSQGDAPTQELGSVPDEGSGDSQQAQVEKPPEDDSGDSPISSIMSGGKAFQSVEKLDVDPTTGTATISIPIEVPAGRAGIQPSINLLYNSSSPNGILGMGWILELGNIQRSTKKGPPKYDSADTFILVQAGSAQELVFDASAGFYRSKNEGAFMKIEQISGYWKVTDKKGTKYYFGQTAQARQSDPNNSNRVFKWCLSRVEDLLGNYMDISYFSDENQIYPDEIIYTGNTQGLSPFARVQFHYGDRADEMTSFISRFRVKTRRKLSSVDVFAEENLQRQYQFDYSFDNQLNRSRLNTVTQYASDGATALPQTTFSYSGSSVNLQPHQGLNNYPNIHIYNSSLVVLADMNADGLVDIVESQSGTNLPWYVYFNNGNFNFNTRVAMTNYPSHGLDDPDLRFIDLNADGLKDVIYSSSPYQVWINNGIDGFNAPFSVNYCPDHSISHQNLLQFVDMNADGAADMLKSYGGNNQPYLIYLNTGGGNFTAPINATNPPIRGTDNVDMQLHDVSGDGLLDAVLGWNPYHIWVNNGVNGFFPEVLTSNSPDISITHQNLTRIVDMNADGLADIVRSHSGNNQPYLIYFNNGNADFNAPVAAVNPPIRGTDNSNAKFIDVNGDGLLDVFLGQVSAGVPYQISLNNGEDGFYPPIVLSNYSNTDLDDNANMLVDLNSDGLIDLLRGAAPQQQYIVYPQVAGNLSSRPNVLTGMDNGIGASMSIEYKNLPVRNLDGAGYKAAFSPTLFNTVKSVTTSVLNETYTTQYQFSSGLWNHPNREFRGFGYGKTIDPDGNYSETWILQDDVYKGRPSRQETRDAAGNLFGKTVNTWQSQEIISGVSFIYPQRKDNFIYDGNETGRRTAEEYFYEESPQLGNLTKAISLGEVNLTTGADINDDSRSSEAEFHNNTSGNNWLLGIPKRAVVKDNNNTIIHQSWFYYDNNENFESLPAIGLLTKKTDWAGGNDFDGPTARYSYDAFGNILTTQNPAGNISTVTYDALYHLFPLTSENSLGHQAVSEYYGVNGVALNSGDGFRGLWGQVKSSTDPNNQQGRKTYDVFGRPVATVSPLDQIDFPTSSVEYEFASLYMKITTHARENHGVAGTIDSVQFYDGLGRLIQTKTESAALGQYIVSGQAQYNSRGLPYRKFNSFFSTNSINTIDPIDLSVPSALVSYDAMGRTVQTTNPDGSYATAIYDDWPNSTIDANGHKQTSYMDAYGRLIRKEEYLGADGRSPNYPQAPFTLYATTLYSYDSDGNLIQVEDAQGNVTNISYDTLGRKTQMNDPDMGVWQYQYDISGNLISQTDAKNQEINFSYDPLNRLINKSTPTNLNVDYVYDDPVVNFSKGRLTKAQYETHDDTKFTYDQLGREIQSAKKIDGIDYEVNRNYDAASRLTQIQYPDQGELFYVYNRAGQIKQVRSGASSYSYDTASKLLLHADGSDGSVVFSDETGKSVANTAAYDAYTKLASHFDGFDGAAAYTDPVFGAYTFSGTAQLDTAQSKFGGSSLYLNGNSSRVSLADSENWHFGAGDFTIDCWVRLNTVSGEQTVWAQWSNASTGAEVRYSSAYGDHWNFSAHNSGIPLAILTGTSTPLPGVWYHLAATRSGNNWYLFVNGSLEASAINSTPYPNYSRPFTLGAENWADDHLADNSLNGWIDEFRVSKGKARWTSNFTPPEYPYGRVAVSTAQSKFGDSSAYFDGAGSKISLSDSDDWNFGSGDLTIDLWVRWDKLGSTPFCSQYNPADGPGGNRWVFMYLHDSNELVMYDATGAVNIRAAWTPDVNTWHHIAYSKSSGTSKIFVDGISLELNTSAEGTFSNSTADLLIGADTADTTRHHYGYIDELRISKGVARWTSDFIPPTESYVLENYDGEGEEYISNVDYNAQGQITRIDYGNGDVTTYDYDPLTVRLGHLVTRTSGDQVIQDLQYSYDSSGNIIAIVDNIYSDSQTFQYDALNRLISAQGSYGVKTYQYDAIGNIIQKDNLTYTYGENGAKPHAVTSLSDGTHFSYDENGNTIQKTETGNRITDYLYDAENRLKEVKVNSTIKARFEYDGDGGRTKKIIYEPSVHEILEAGIENANIPANDELSDDEPAMPIFPRARYIRNLSPSELNPQVEVQTVTTKFVGSLYEKRGNQATRHIFLGDMRVASITGGNIYYYHGDHLGSTNVVTDSAGVLKELIEYEPYGQFSRHERLGTSDEEQAQFYFTGKQLDDETGLYYYGARYYDPKLGRFITADTIVQDPVGNPQTLNRYSYVSNNPVNRTDPDGHSWKSFWKKWGDFVSPLGRAVVTGDWANFGYQMLNVVAIASGNPWFVAAGILGFASRATSHIGDNASSEVSRVLGYAGTAAAAIGAGIEIGKGIKAWTSEKGNFYDIQKGPDNGFAGTKISEADIVAKYGQNGVKPFTNGVGMSLDDSIQMAGRRGADVLFYNPSHGAVADFTESFLQTVTGTGSLDRQLGHLATQLRVDLVGYSQGSIISSNAMIYAGLHGGAVQGSSLTTIGSAVGSFRAHASAWMAGVTRVYGETHVFDPIKLTSSEISPFGYVNGFLGAITGGGQHVNY